MNYHQLMRVEEARRISAEFGGSVSKVGDSIEVKHNCISSIYNPDGTIEVRSSYNAYTKSGERNFMTSSALPPGVEWFGFCSPAKHYLRITKGSRVRYWLMPVRLWNNKEGAGLTLVPNDRLGYVPMRAMQDYRYILDKKELKYYQKEKYAAVLSKLDKLWPYLAGETRTQGFTRLDIDNEATWFPHFDWVKYSGEGKQVVRGKILARIREQVPLQSFKLDPSEYHHNKYWHYAK